MKCTVHPDRKSVGRCLKCGRPACKECLIKVTQPAQAGKQTKPLAILVCRECIKSARPDLALPTTGRGSKRAGIHPALVKPPGKRSQKSIAIAAVLVLVVLAAAGVALYLPRPDVSQELVPPETIVANALQALTSENKAAFLACVDVEEFMCRMDPTGLTKRDYDEAGKERRKELEVVHGDLLSSDLFVKGNTKNTFRIVNKEIKENSALLTVNPWIQFGKKLYKRILLEKRHGAWKICGLRSPDY